MFSRLMIEKYLAPVPADCLVSHYTPISTLCHFIADEKGWGSAWATPIQFLNDRLELSWGLDIINAQAQAMPGLSMTQQSIIDQLRTTFGTLETDAYQMSCSGNPDELGQWRGYGANGMGCSVVTDAQAVHAAANVAGWVLYDRNMQTAFAQQVLMDLLHETDPDTIVKTIVAASSFMKHDGFEPEMEFRLLKFPAVDEVKFRGSGERIVPYVDYLNHSTYLPLKKIIIGPGWQLSQLSATELARNHVAQGISRLLSARRMSLTPESSRIPYDPK